MRKEQAKACSCFYCLKRRITRGLIRGEPAQALSYPLVHLAGRAAGLELPTNLRAQLPEALRRGLRYLLHLAHLGAVVAYYAQNTTGIVRLEFAGPPIYTEFP